MAECHRPIKIKLNNHNQIDGSRQENRVRYVSERKMAMRKTDAIKDRNRSCSGFPAEAQHFYDEVSEQQLEELRRETNEKFAGEEWDVIDGLEFSYEKCA